MDPALRQRLIGAAVLILLAVIFVPMLLDGPSPEVDTREVSLDIPPQPTETRRLPVEPSSLPPAATNDAPATSDEDAVGMVQRPAEPAVSTVIPTPVLDEAPPPVEPTTKPPTAPAPPAAAAADGRYVVRFGSFGDRANADRLVQRLAAQGVSASIEPVKAGERTLQRVVSQPLADRAGAEKMRLSVRKAMPEISAQVAELDLPEVTASRVTQPVTRGWAVQVGVFSTAEAAEKLVADLRRSGQEGYFERMPSDGKVLYRVRVGPLARREEADRARAQIKQVHKLEGLVVSYP